MNSITPRTILVTVASKGLGRAAADRLAPQGHQLIGLARSLPKEPFPVEFITVDLGDIEQTQSVLADLTDRYAITGLINNVGLSQGQLLEDIELSDLSKVLDRNRPRVEKIWS